MCVCMYVFVCVLEGGNVIFASLQDVAISKSYRLKQLFPFRN